MVWLDVKRFSFAIALMVFFAIAVGCATVPAADSAALARIKRVGVVSMVGDKLFYHQFGFLAFGNSKESSNISSWALDAQWEARITEAANVTGLVEAIDLDVDRAALFATYPAENAWPRQWRSLNIKKARGEFQRIAQESNVDALLVLASTGFDAQQAIIEGISIFSDETIAGRNSVYWVVAELHLIDGASGELLTTRGLGKSEVFGVSYPFEKAPEALRVKRYSQYSKSEIEEARGQFAAIPDDYWAPTVTWVLSPRDAQKSK